MNLNKTTIFIVLFSLQLTVALAQKENFTSHYNNAKDLFKSGKYGLAMQAFKPLTEAVESNPYPEYASFFYALSAYHNGDVNVAKSMLVQIKANYPHWDKIGDVNLWLTKIYFQQGEMDKALETRMSIKNQDMANELDGLEAQYLEPLEYPMLDSLFHLYPSDKVMAKTLADKITQQPLDDQDRDLLENIVSLFNFDKEKYRIEEAGKSVKKPVYEVAVMLPFMYDNLVNSPQRITNQFVVDLYQGILLAQDNLRKEGIRITVHAYDTQSDSLATAKILQNPEMQFMDLIIGPLYPAPVKAVSDFAYHYKINMINPLSGNSAVVLNNPYAFLFMPTYETQGRLAADFVSDKIHNKNAFIFFDASEKDSVLAYAYKDEIESKGFVIPLIQKIKRDEAKQIIDILTNSAEVNLDPSEIDSLTNAGSLQLSEKEILRIRPDSIGHILISSDQAPLVANAITALETRGDSIALIGKSRWLESNVLPFEALERLNSLMIAPDYFDKSSDRVKRVAQQYTSKYNSIPGENALIGYEATIVMGKLMNQFGNLFQYDQNSHQMISGDLSQGYIFDDHNSNQYVPIVKFENAQVEVANPYKP